MDNLCFNFIEFTLDPNWLHSNGSNVIGQNFSKKETEGQNFPFKKRDRDGNSRSTHCGILQVPVLSLGWASHVQGTQGWRQAVRDWPACVFQSLDFPILPEGFHDPSCVFIAGWGNSYKPSYKGWHTTQTPFFLLHHILRKKHHSCWKVILIRSSLLHFSVPETRAWHSDSKKHFLCSNFPKMAISCPTPCSLPEYSNNFHSHFHGGIKLNSSSV